MSGKGIKVSTAQVADSKIQSSEVPVSEISGSKPEGEKSLNLKFYKIFLLFGNFTIY